MEDTICAISTSIGIGAISIVRVTGPEAINIVDSIFDHDLKNASSHTIHYGHIKYNEEVIDEVLVMLMRGPKTYTTEDTIEINCHGGINTTKKIMEVLLASGCRLAEPGEFTKRAYLNGRINLLEAESVNDLIVAKTDAARTLAINNVDGKLSKQISTLRDKIAKILANIEVNIDYPEYTDELQVTEDLMHGYLNEIKEELDSLVSGSKNGRLIKNGVNIAIIGKPNVGKSSILNNFLDEEKAIVTDIAGTTRDIVEGNISLNGVELKLIDTAGKHDTDDYVEKIGVNKSLEKLNNADLVILVLDGSKELDENDNKLLTCIDKTKTIIFVNKSDLPQKINLNLKDNVIYGSAKEVEGLSKLKEKIIDMFNLNEINKDLTYLSNVRQIDLVKKAYLSINNAKNSLSNGIPIEMISTDLKECYEFLGEIIGKTYKDDIIDRLFQDFCVGK